jgi:hypothetical protein
LENQTGQDKLSMKIGYAMVSTKDQHLELLSGSLKKAGCENIYQDVARGPKAHAPNWINYWRIQGKAIWSSPGQASSSS